MAALAVESGETLSVETIVQLRGQIEAFYILITLQSRSFDFIQQHRAVWKNAYEFFNAAVLIWERVPIIAMPLRTGEKLSEIASSFIRSRNPTAAITNVGRWRINIGATLERMARISQARNHDRKRIMRIAVEAADRHREVLRELAKS
jgi:hypothetical protein